jgi:uncharacterized protein YndB with AHSA1/START domain
MSKFYIEKSILISASVDKVWDVLTSAAFVHEWSQCFGVAVHPETDWDKGSEIVWKDDNGKPSARGLVTAHEGHQLLRIAFEDHVSSVKPIVPGKYSETYRLLEDGNHTFLSFYGGELSQEDHDHHTPLWDKALSEIKKLSEQ